VAEVAAPADVKSDAMAADALATQTFPALSSETPAGEFKPPPEYGEFVAGTPVLER